MIIAWEQRLVKTFTGASQGFLKVETKSAFTAESAKNAEKNLKNSANPAFSAVNFWYSTNLRKP